jgi:peroxiredoxin Q/BCP
MSPSSASHGSARIVIGQPAPDFRALLHDGREFRLADLRGQKAVVLFFYPHDHTPVCTQEACAFRDSYEEFTNLGAEVIGVSSGSPASHRSFADKHGLPFPLICDADGQLRRLFQVPKTLGFLPGRVTYVIDRDGVIRMIFTSQFAAREHVRRAMAILQA